MTLTEIIQTAEAAAPWVLGVLIATTTLAHALVRAARAFHRYALTTPSTLDDEVGERAVRFSEAAASVLEGLAAILPRIGVGRVPTAPPQNPPRRRPPTPPLVVLTLLCAALVSGCGGGAIRVHAHAAAVTAGAVTVAGATVDDARAAALDRVEAEHPTDPEHDEELDREAARWRPVGIALDGTRTALHLWLDSLDLATRAGDDDALPMLVPIAARVVRLYDDAARLATELGVTLPRLPTAVLALIGGAS